MLVADSYATDTITGAVLGRQNTSSVQLPPNMAAANFVVTTLSPSLDGGFAYPWLYDMIDSA